MVTLLTLESIFTDAEVIVVSTTLLQTTLTSGSDNSLSAFGRAIASALSIGAVAGGVSGVLWGRFLTATRSEQYDDIFTLSVLLLLYAVVEQLGGNGAVFALVFGLVLANGTSSGRLPSPDRLSRRDDKYREGLARTLPGHLYPHTGIRVISTTSPFKGLLAETTVG